MTQATARTSQPPPRQLATTWQMWVPCIGMALCSWLSFVDRQVLNILSPTIIKDTGLTTAGLHRRHVVLLPHLHARQPGVGIGARPRRPAHRHAARRRRVDRGEHVARADGELRRLRARSRRARTRRRRHVPRRTAHGGRNAACRPARARHRALLQRRHDRRGHDAAAAGAAGDPVRLEDRVHRHRRPRRGLDADLGGHRAAAVPAEERAHDVEDGVAEPARTARVGARSSATRCRRSRRDRC